MTVSKEKIHLERGPKINFSRPAIDPLFYSAAINHGPNAIGVILSGRLDDGSAGLRAIKRCSGVSIVQADAQYPEMPQSASKAVSVDYFLPSEEISSVLIQLASREIDNSGDKKTPELFKIEVDINNADDRGSDQLNKIATPSSYSCPDCSGVLWKINDFELERYRCRVGHAHTLKTLDAGLAIKAEDALWSAMRVLEEKQQMANKIAFKVDKENIENKNYFQEKANKIGEQIKTIQEIIEKLS